VSIGPVTSDAVRAAGITLVAEAEQASIPSLVGAVIAEFAGESVGTQARSPERRR
jgi:uroporphyrinogen-III synthase